MSDSLSASRKWALTKVARGDWLLPSNDSRTLWRISEYAEDGSTAVSADGKTWRPLPGTFWQTAKYRDPLPESGVLPDNFLDWDHWETWDTGLLKRKSAIEAVINRG